MFHAASGLLGLVVVELVSGRLATVAIALALALSAWTMEWTRRQSTTTNDRLMALFGPMAHAHERFHVNSATWYCTALVVLAALAGDIAAGLGVLVLGVADPVAAQIGRRFGRLRIRAQRTFEGSLGFVVTGFAVSLLALGIFHPEVPHSTRMALAMVAAVSGALAELFSFKLDDNLTIPLAVGGAVTVAGLLLGVTPG